MNRSLFARWLMPITKATLFLALVSFSLGLGNVSSVSAGTSQDQGACGEKLTEAKARFMSTLSADGSVPASPEAKAAAEEYIRVGKLCYDQMTAQSGALATDPSTSIDDGGVLLDNSNAASAEYVSAGSKWGSTTPGTSGGTVTYSFMGNGISFSAENNGNNNYGNSVALTSLPGFQPCFITEIQNAFAAWSAISNIKFVQVSDNGAAFNASGAAGDIRIAAHAFDGPSNTLAHAYYPPPNGNSAAGDMHFDSAENWTCNSSGIEIGLVAMHEIGHAVGLAHENTSTVAVMDPVYNVSLSTLQADDIKGAQSLYGAPAPLAAPPPNDDIANAIAIGLPYSDTVDTTGANPTGDGPAGSVLCDGKYINKGKYNVWYQYTVGSTQKVSFDTFGSYTASGDAYDTYIAVWSSSLAFQGCSDDTAANLQSQLVIKLNPGTYYIEVAQYNGDAGTPVNNASGGTLKFRALASGGGDTVGVFRPSNGVLFLKNTNATGYADIAINYGQGGDYPVAGDWDGNGTATIGIYRAGSFYLRNANTIGYADVVFAFGSGTPGDQPIAGDWDGDGVDTIGVYNSNTITFYLRNSNSAGPANYIFRLGIPGDIGIAGDWTNKGYDTVGVFRPSNGVIFLKNTNQTGYADIAINYGIGGDKPVTGDWDGNGTDTIGVLRGNMFYLRDSNTVGYADKSFALGLPGDMPIAGNWDGIP